METDVFLVAMWGRGYRYDILKEITKAVGNGMERQAAGKDGVRKAQRGWRETRVLCGSEREGEERAYSVGGVSEKRMWGGGGGLTWRPNPVDPAVIISADG